MLNISPLDLAVASLNTVNVDQSTTLPPVSVNKTFNILDETLSCPPVEGRLKIDVSVKADAVAAIGVAAEGTIIPPKISDFAITTSKFTISNSRTNSLADKMVLVTRSSLQFSVDRGPQWCTYDERSS